MSAISTSAHRIRGQILGAALVTCACTACSAPSDYLQDPRAYPYRLERDQSYPPSRLQWDLDGDGTDELVHTYRFARLPGRSDLDAVVLFNAKGETIDQANFNGRVLLPYAVDVEGDGRTELLVPLVRNDSLFVSAVDFDGKKRFGFFLTTGLPRREPDGSLPWDPFVLGFYAEDTDEDGVNELVTVVSTGYARLPRGVLVHEVPTGRPRGRVIVGIGLARSYLGDFDGDGDREVLLEGWATKNGAVAGGFDDRHAHIVVVELKHGPKLSFARTVADSAFQQLQYEDFDGDGKREVLSFTGGWWSGGPDAELQLLEPGTWRILRRRGLARGFRFGVAAQLNRSAGVEIVTLTPSGEAWVFDGGLSIVGRRILEPRNRTRLDRLADLDGDGLDEIAAYGRNEVAILGADLRPLAITPIDTSVRAYPAPHPQYGAGVAVFHRDGRAPQLLRYGWEASEALRLVPNRLYLFYRHSRAISLVGAILLLPPIGLGFARLRQRNRTLREVQLLAVDASPTGFLLLERRGTVAWINETLRRWLALPTEKAPRSRRIDGQFQGAPPLLAFCRTLLSLKPPRYRDTSSTLLVGGQERPVKLSAQPLNRSRTGADWLIRVDDTAAPEELSESGTWALMAERVAHDLKNPLTSVLLTVRRMRIEYRDSAPEVADRLDPYCERIEDRVDHLRRLTSNFMKLMRADEQNRQIVRLDELVESQADVLRASVPPDIHLKLHSTAPGPAVCVDKEQIESVLQNLVANAVNAMPDGGDLTITAGFGRTVHLAPPGSDGECALIEVADSGVGIDPAIRHRIFEPGFTTSGHGSGLGLAMVQKIILDHQGRVEVESEPGDGTVVSVYLPTASELATLEAADAASASRDAPRRGA